VKPYYQDAFVTLYHGDSRVLLAGLADAVDCVVTDPPYGISYKPLRGSNGSKMWGKETVTGDNAPFDPAPLLALSKPTILWGANH
jgi:DNA modification methylase